METQYISLNMTPTGVNPCFHISQYDVGRILGFIVHAGGVTVDLDTYTCTVEATRSDGTAITSAVATIDNIGTFEVTPTMSNKADKYRCQLVIVDENSKRIASLPFDMEVTKAAMDENSESIEEDASLYQQYTEAVQGAIAEVNADIQAEENARIAAVSAEATARQTADNTLQGNINSEAATRASADSNLQSQIDQIVAPSGEAPSAAEVQNARIGADGVTYPTLGDAIRTQNANLKNALNETVVRVNNNDFQYGHWTNSGTHNVNYIRLCNKTAIRVYKGDRLEFSPDGLYVSFLVFPSVPSASSQSYLESTPYQTSANVINYTIRHDGYLVFNMQNGEDWSSSTEPSSTKQYNAILVVYRYAVIAPVEDRIDNLNDSLNSKVSLMPVDIQVEKVAGYYNTDSRFLGGGTRIKSFAVIDGILANFRSDTAGTAYCEILDEDMNLLATSESTVEANKNVYFAFDHLTTGKEIIWVRMYGGDNVIPKRSEITIVNPAMLSKQENNEYHIRLSASGWEKTASSAYCIPFTVYGEISKKTIRVGSKEYYVKISDAVNYANSNPNYEWDILIDGGTYNLYEELGGDEWYSAIDSTNGNMQGLMLNNCVNLFGIGDVTLQLLAPDALATSSNVPNLSVIELPRRNNKIENVKIIGKNVRYAIHDETDGKEPNSKRSYKNVTATHNGVVSGTWSSPASFGCGTSDNSYFEFENCTFSNAWLAHQNQDQTIPPIFIAKNCQFLNGSYAVSLNTSGTCKAYITFISCFIDYMVRIIEETNIWTITGSGNNDFNWVVIGNVYNQMCYQLPDKVIMKQPNANIPRLSPVTLTTNGKLTKATSHIDFVGILINGVDTTETGIVIKSGYVNCYTFSPFYDGDLIGVDSTGLVVDTVNPIGKAITIDGLQQIYLFGN